MEEVRKIRSRGYSVSYSEKVEGVGAVACSIRDRQGVVYGGVTIVAPDSRVRHMDLQAAGEIMAETAHRIKIRCQVVGNATLSTR
jgi:DNA-binding IclR family transcriptional regulator